MDRLGQVVGLSIGLSKRWEKLGVSMLKCNFVPPTIWVFEWTVRSSDLFSTKVG
jgi:hypothetical protein